MGKYKQANEFQSRPRPASRRLQYGTASDGKLGEVQARIKVAYVILTLHCVCIVHVHIVGNGFAAPRRAHQNVHQKHLQMEEAKNR